MIKSGVSFSKSGDKVLKLKLYFLYMVYTVNEYY